MPFRIPFLRFLIWFAGLLAVAVPAFAQSAAPSAQTRHAVVHALANELLQRYVFPDRGASASKALLDADAAGAFDSASDGPAFAAALTTRLASILHDKHLRVRYSADPFPPHEADQAPSAQQYQRYKEDVAKSNFGLAKVARLPGNVGYLDVRAFPDAPLMAPTLAAAMNFVANTDALVIDLRKNGGGDPAAVALLVSYFVPESDLVHVNDIFLRTAKTTGGETQQFWSVPVTGSRYIGKPVYVLTSSRTFSGGEEFAYDMQTEKRATLVGETTGGGANPGDSVTLDPHFAAFIPTGRAINPITKTNWEGVGVKPDVATTADRALSTVYVTLLQKKLSATTDPDVHQALLDLIAGATKDPSSILND